MEINNKKNGYFHSKKSNHLKIKIGVSGTILPLVSGSNIYDQSKELGREIIRQGGVLVTCATEGFSLWSAIGAKEENGMSIGISPAANEREHIETYRLPTDYMDIIIYTGFGFSGRDLLFTRSSDAIIINSEGTNALNEFMIAFWDNKPVGVLENESSKVNNIKDIINRTGRSTGNVVFSKDPRDLVKKIMELATKNSN